MLAFIKVIIADECSVTDWNFQPIIIIIIIAINTSISVIRVDWYLLNDKPFAAICGLTCYSKPS